MANKSSVSRPNSNVTVDTLHQRWLVLMLRNELQAPCPLAV